MPRSFHSWYEEHYPVLTGRGLWLRGQELNRLAPAEYDRRPLRVLISRLSTYADTAESITHGLLYAIAAGTEGVFADTAFLPPGRDGSIMEQHAVPWLLGTGTKYRPEAFDVVALSNAIVQEIVNIPAMLRKSGIPLEKHLRMEDPAIPLIILGGANALHTSVLWTRDPLVDGIFIGECAQCIARVFSICRDAKTRNTPKYDILNELASVPGFFLPDRPPKTTVCRHAGIADRGSVDGRIGSLVSDQANRATVQISEGCPCFCSFCAESYGRKPYREESAKTVIEKALRLKSNLGLDRCDLYSFNFNLHSELSALLPELVERFAGIGLKTQRFDSLARETSLIPALKAIGKSSLTCALEGISSRLRRYLHKNLNENELRRSLGLLLSAKFRELKVFLIATGLEEESDFAELKDLADFCAETMRAAGTRPRVVFSLTPLVRFSWTPLEFEDAFDTDRYLPIMNRIASIVRSRQFEYRQSMEIDEWWVSQVLVRASKPDVRDAFIKTALEMGFVYYREVPSEFAAAFRKKLFHSGIASEALLAGRDPATSRAAPWSQLNPGIDRQFIVDQHRYARTFEERDICLGSHEAKGACLACGSCADDEQRRLLTATRPLRRLSPAILRDRITRLRKEEVALHFRMEVGPPARGLPREVIAAALARAIMRNEPRAIDWFRRFDGTYWQRRDCAWITGDDVVTLRWRPEGRDLRDRMGDPRFLASTNSELGQYGILMGMAPETEPARVGLIIESPFPFAGQSYFRANRLPYTERKDHRGSHYEFSREARKRQSVLDLHLCAVEGCCRIEVTAGPKFELGEFLRRAFTLPDLDAWIRIPVRAHLSWT